MQLDLKRELTILHISCSLRVCPIIAFQTDTYRFLTQLILNCDDLNLSLEILSKIFTLPFSCNLSFTNLIHLSSPFYWASHKCKTVCLLVEITRHSSSPGIARGFVHLSFGMPTNDITPSSYLPIQLPVTLEKSCCHNNEVLSAFSTSDKFVHRSIICYSTTSHFSITI